MSYLLYSSDEMYSSTELLRKSKSIFDKVHNKEIEKAIILRDGKPTFVLFDFEEYEKTMREFESLKARLEAKSIETQTNIQTTIQVKEQIQEDSPEISENLKKDSNDSIEEVSEQIDAKNKQKEKQLDDFIGTLEIDEPEESRAEIKEFWNK